MSNISTSQITDRNRVSTCKLQSTLQLLISAASLPDCSSNSLKSILSTCKPFQTRISPATTDWQQSLAAVTTGHNWAVKIKGNKERGRQRDGIEFSSIGYMDCLATYRNRTLCFSLPFCGHAVSRAFLASVVFSGHVFIAKTAANNSSVGKFLSVCVRSRFLLARLSFAHSFSASD